MDKVFDKSLKTDVLDEILKNYQPISLNEMDCVKMMNRTDTKYFFHASLFIEILKRASNFYRVLEIDNQRQFEYFTTYFDTQNYSLYLDHQNGKRNRYKVRQRRYVSTGVEYFEVKHKTNKGWTLKSRIKNNDPDCLNSKTDVFLKDKTPYNNSILKKVLYNDFHRITLVSNKLDERATLDFSISFSNFKNNFSYPMLGIAEVKQDASSGKSKLVEILRDLKLRPMGISKYCLGIASLCEGVKINSLKPSIIKINKLKYGN
jgi:hypothetical protein